MRVEIKCIVKADRLNAHERIKSVGGVNPNGASWSLSLDDAIRGVENGTYAFWTQGGGRVVDVIVASHLGHKYLKTVNDGVQPDNLLSLPPCR